MAVFQTKAREIYETSRMVLRDGDDDSNMRELVDTSVNFMGDVVRVFGLDLCYLFCNHEVKQWHER